MPAGVRASFAFLAAWVSCVLLALELRYDLWTSDVAYRCFFRCVFYRREGHGRVLSEPYAFAVTKFEGIYSWVTVRCYFIVVVLLCVTVATVDTDTDIARTR